MIAETEIGPVFGCLLTLVLPLAMLAIAVTLIVIAKHLGKIEEHLRHLGKPLHLSPAARQLADPASGSEAMTAAAYAKAAGATESEVIAAIQAGRLKGYVDGEQWFVD
jgi:hypothetical protein